MLERGKVHSYIYSRGPFYIIAQLALKNYIHRHTYNILSLLDDSLLFIFLHPIMYCLNQRNCWHPLVLIKECTRLFFHLAYTKLAFFGICINPKACPPLTFINPSFLEGCPPLTFHQSKVFRGVPTSHFSSTQGF